ncbi:MAG: trehalase family glycosidase [bacterium]|nr:trehalase family glycosidase [bacterium]
MQAVYLDDGYGKLPGVLPAGRIVHDVIFDTDAVAVVKEFILSAVPSITRQPLNQLKHPYLVPGATYNDLWDWDALFTSCSVPEEWMEYARGSILNLLDSPLQNGRPSKKATVEGEYDYYLHPYPLRAQFAYIVGCRLKDFSWIEPFMDKLVEIMDWYEQATRDNEGFFKWQTLTGIDNNPSVYGRPPGATAGVDLAAFHYREYRALGKLAAIFGRKDEGLWREKAEELRDLVRTGYWDEIDGYFYDIDRNIDYGVPGRQKITWQTYLKFRNCSCLYPLWGGMANDEQVAYMVKAIMDENEFLSFCGIRTHSKYDPVYNNELSGGPSNWQGPVWGLNTCLTAYGLARYGYKKEALDVALRLVKTFALDIRQNGCMHEYYHGDTGQPLIKPGFLNWNMLAGRIMDDIEGGIDCTTLDLLDD